jgi:hypothetical protein
MATQEPKWAASNTDSPFYRDILRRLMLAVFQEPARWYEMQLGQVNAAQSLRIHIKRRCYYLPLTALMVGRDGRAMPFLTVGVELYAANYRLCALQITSIHDPRSYWVFF